MNPLNAASSPRLKYNLWRFWTVTWFWCWCWSWEAFSGIHRQHPKNANFKSSLIVSRNHAKVFKWKYWM